MNYHNITTSDMLNGEGLRVVLWVSGCNHHCKNCHNPQTWDPNSGIPFDQNALKELILALNEDYHSGITYSGGDPLFPSNRGTIAYLTTMIKKYFPKKTQWIYSGFTFEEICNNAAMLEIIKNCDVLVEGEFKEELLDVSLPWKGSSNQRVIDLNKTFEKGEIILWENQ